MGVGYDDRDRRLLLKHESPPGLPDGPSRYTLQRAGDTMKWCPHSSTDYIPIPCPPCAAESSLSFGRSATIASVVSIKDATDDAFCRAKRDTLVGSMTPALNRSSYWPVAALKPNAPLPSLTLFTTMLPSQPPFCTIWRMGSSSALRMMSTPNFSPSSTFSESSTLEARRYATPPPGTMPSSTAAR